VVGSAAWGAFQATAVVTRGPHPVGGHRQRGGQSLLV